MVYPKYRIAQDQNLFKLAEELTTVQETLQLQATFQEEQEKKIAVLASEREKFKNAYMEQLKKREQDLQDYTTNQRTVQQSYQVIFWKEKCG